MKIYKLSLTTKDGTVVDESHRKFESLEAAKAFCAGLGDSDQYEWHVKQVKSPIYSVIFQGVGDITDIREFKDFETKEEAMAYKALIESDGHHKNISMQIIEED